MKNTFEDFERKVKSLNEDEIEFPIDLGTMQVVETPAEGEDKPKVEVTEIKTEKCSEHEKKEEKEECDCPFKKAMDMLDFAKTSILKLKNAPKPAPAVPGGPMPAGEDEYGRIRRTIMAALDFVRGII